jgi:8-oxo-dGTP pyrophosphatase MutT (NUDIX family)
MKPLNIIGPITTAGVLLFRKPWFVFQIGPTPDHARIAFVRLGGHLQNQETPFQCACREVMEEAQVRIDYCQPSFTYFTEVSEQPDFFHRTLWPTSYNPYKPILVACKKDDPHPGYSITYLAETEESPAPSGEAVGLILLELSSISLLDEKDVTLSRLISSGAQVLERQSLDRKAPIYPHLQVRFLISHLKEISSTLHQ